MILLKSIYHEIFVLMNKNVFLEHILLSKTFCILYNYIILVSKKLLCSNLKKFYGAGPKELHW